MCSAASPWPTKSPWLSELLFHGGYCVSAVSERVQNADADIKHIQKRMRASYTHKCTHAHTQAHTQAHKDIHWEEISRLCLLGACDFEETILSEKSL